MFQVEPAGMVAIMRFDRAEKKNALTPGMLRSLCAAINTASSARAIVLSGVGDTFCSGFDLSACRDDPNSTVLSELLETLAAAVRALRQAPCPVIVSAHGAAIAGGCALLGGADFVITTTTAKLGYPVVKLGISPAVSAPTVRLLLGDGAIRTRMLDSQLIDGTRAVELGLCDETTPDAAACEARAIAKAQDLASKPPHALAYTKRWLNTLDGSNDTATLDHALAVSLGLVGTEEQQTRLAAVWKK